MWGSVYLADSQQSVSIAAVNRRCHVCDTVFCQGDCVLTVQLDEDEEKEADFYLIFSGSTQRHVSSTLRVSHVTLQAMCPGITHTHTHVYTCMHMHTLTLARLVEWIFEIPEQRVQKFCRWMKVCVFTWVELLQSPPAFIVHWSSPVLVPLIQTWAPLGWDLEPGTICTDSQCGLLYSVLHTFML